MDGRVGFHLFSVVLFFLLFLVFFPPFSFMGQEPDLEGEIALTPEQRVKVEEIKRRYLQEIFATRDEIMRKRLEIVNEMRKGKANREKILRMRRDIEDLKLKREMLYERYKDEITAVLSPQQRRIFEDFCRSERKRSRRILE